MEPQRKRGCWRDGFMSETAWTTVRLYQRQRLLPGPKPLSGSASPNIYAVRGVFQIQPRKTSLRGVREAQAVASASRVLADRRTAPNRAQRPGLLGPSGISQPSRQLAGLVRPSMLFRIYQGNRPALQCRRSRWLWAQKHSPQARSRQTRSFSEEQLLTTIILPPWHRISKFQCCHVCPCRTSPTDPLRSAEQAHSCSDPIFGTLEKSTHGGHLMQGT
jgi:hypothetical protein